MFCLSEDVISDRRQVRRMFHTGLYTCVLCKDGVTLASQERGVLPLVKFLDQWAVPKGCAAADKVVGLAAANLYLLLGVDYVYTKLASRDAIMFLCNNGVLIEYEESAWNILNRKRNGICPMEEAVAHAESPKIALQQIRQKLKQLSEDANAPAVR